MTHLHKIAPAGARATGDSTGTPAASCDLPARPIVPQAPDEASPPVESPTARYMGQSGERANSRLCRYCGSTKKHDRRVCHMASMGKNKPLTALQSRILDLAVAMYRETGPVNLSSLMKAAKLRRSTYHGAVCRLAERGMIRRQGGSPCVTLTPLLTSSGKPVPAFKGDAPAVRVERRKGVPVPVTICPPRHAHGPTFPQRLSRGL